MLLAGNEERAYATLCRVTWLPTFPVGALTPNHSFKTHAPDQTGQRLRHLHWYVDLVALGPLQRATTSRTFSWPFVGRRPSGTGHDSSPAEARGKRKGMRFAGLKKSGAGW